MQSGTGKARTNLQQEQHKHESGQTGYMHISNDTGNHKGMAILHLFFATNLASVLANFLGSHQPTFLNLALPANSVFYNFQWPTIKYTLRRYVSPRRGNLTYSLIVMSVIIPTSAAEATPNIIIQPSASEPYNRHSAGLLDYVVTVLILAVLIGCYLIKETDLATRIQVSTFWSKPMYWAPSVLFITILNLVIIGDGTASLVIWVG